MTNVIFLAIALVIMAAPSATEVPPRQSGGNAMGRDEAQQKLLFVHLLAPGSSPGAAAHRLASTRIYLSQDFTVSVGDPDNPFTNHWDGAWTNARIGTNGVAEKRSLGSIWNSGDAVLAGRIEVRQGKFFAQLQGRNQSTLNYFQGEIELEKPVEEHGGWYQGAIWGVWFALSESSDCGAFLRDLSNGTLRSPAIVASDSPQVKHWLDLNSNTNSGSKPPAFLRDQEHACLRNLKQIDAAKEQWALLFKKVAGAEVDEAGVNAFISGESAPKCPQGGKYRYNKIGEQPACTLHGSITKFHVPPNDALKN